MQILPSRKHTKLLMQLKYTCLHQAGWLHTTVCYN